jgi:lipid-A-disaccharide synthase
MTKAGIQSVFPMEDIAVMGLQQILPRLKLIYQRINETVESIIQSNTDAVVFIDSPEFAVRVAKRLRRLRPYLPMIKYGAPTVWAWRPGRAKAIQPYPCSASF